jgi:hypothetical protein
MARPRARADGPPALGTPVEALRAWRAFADSTQVDWNGERRSWREHIAGRGFSDEERLVQPRVFPRFARELLGFDVGVTLAAERVDEEGKPDFTPADAVTHPFVFETKGTQAGVALAGFDPQVRRYLVHGRPRIRRVVLTNMVGLRVFELAEGDQPRELFAVNLRALLDGDEQMAAGLADARNLVTFFEAFRYRTLNLEQKLDQVRQAPEWNPITEVTSSSWISARLDRVVAVLTSDVEAQIAAGALDDRAQVAAAEASRVVDELRLLAWRLGADFEEVQENGMAEFTRARENSPLGKALRQYQAHLAYYAATRLLLVRTWEDLGLLDSVLHDGGFDHWMDAFHGVVADVVGHSFTRAENRYRSLFAQQNSYTWYRPSTDALTEGIYELGNTYLGAIESDVLGEVYERLLERIDRKILGQYYTPRDVIRLIWDLIGLDDVALEADQEDRPLRILDIATGSGGFLVEAARRMGARYIEAREMGAALDRQEWITRLAAGLTGVEIQRFPSYLAELNLLIQLARVLADNPDLRVPPLGVIPTDTLSLHNPDALLEGAPDLDHADLLIPDEERRARALAIKDPYASGEFADVAVGNPPYVGEKAGAAILASTRERHPYWGRYVGHHMDYLYWFLILGISKLRAGGRFGFITTEYWLRATGAQPLREYIAANCRVDRLVLFRHFRLFPDAPGQDSLIVVGTRTTDPLGEGEVQDESRPRVSVYRGGAPRSEAEREVILENIRRGVTGAGVETFAASRSPNALGRGRWSEVVLTLQQLNRRQQLGAIPLDLDPEEGVLPGANRMRTSYARRLNQHTLAAIGWPERKHGIFVLTPDEVEQLGALTEEEQQVLRPFVNTQEVFPYATVTPLDGDLLIYLPAPQAGDPQRAREAPFPPNLPNLERHLRQFKPILDAKVAQYDENRPWWSLHRGRRGIIRHDRPNERWADYCLTANWGTGGRLFVGLAPGRSAPAHGLHALLTPEGVPAPYVNAVLNATVVQELAETLPPGYLRREDLSELGAPLLPDSVERISRSGIELADLVASLVQDHAPRFPLIPLALRENPALDSSPDDAWTPLPLGPAVSGALPDLAWVEAVRRVGARSAKVKFVTITETLFGLSVIGQSSAVAEGPAVAVDIRTREMDLAHAAAALVRGVAARGGTLGDVESLRVAIDPDVLTRAFAEDRGALDQIVENYRALREDVDDIVEQAV